MQALAYRLSGVRSVTSSNPEANEKDSAPSRVIDASSEDGLADVSVHGTALREVEIQDYIGRELRNLYEHVLDEEIPESLLRLISDLQLQQTQKP